MPDVVCLALGSRGDVQPFLALALELQARGRSVLIAALGDYKELVEKEGIPFVTVGGRIDERLDWDLVYQSQRNPWELGRVFRKLVLPFLEQVMDDCAKACDGAGLVLASTLGLVPAYELGLDVVPVHFHPMGATREVPSVHFPWVPKGTLSYVSHVLHQLFFWRLLVSGNWFRWARRVWKHQDRAVLYAYPQELLPRPTDWPQHVVVCGPWTLSTEAESCPKIELFLKKGPAPVYIGFGSLLAGPEPESITRMLIEALELSGNRGILYKGWGDLAQGSMPSHILAIDSVDHRWLFPHCRAVVTHGGIGTVTASLQAQTPPVLVPFFGDQKLWAEQLNRNNLTSFPIPRRRLNKENLIRALGSLSPRRIQLPNRAAMAAQKVEELIT